MGMEKEQVREVTQPFVTDGCAIDGAFSKTIIKKIRLLKQKVKQRFSRETEFSKRIKFRYAAFWKNGFGHGIPSWPQGETEGVITKLRLNKSWQRELENKYNSREFVKSYGCRVPDLYWQGKDYTTLDFDSLPDRYVLRPTIGYSARSVFLMEGNLNLLDNQTYTKDELVEQMQAASAAYPDLEFLCEEFLADEKGEHRIPDDYKFFMLNGEVASIQLINRFGPMQNGLRGAVKCYDEHWNPMEMITTSNFSEAGCEPPPNCLPEMIRYAKKLSNAYQIFVRIDLYATQKGAVFGEFCPTPLRGNGFTPYGSELLMGMWEKNCKGMI